MEDFWKYLTRLGVVATILGNAVKLEERIKSHFSKSKNGGLLNPDIEPAELKKWWVKLAYMTAIIAPVVCVISGYFWLSGLDKSKNAIHAELASLRVSNAWLMASLLERGRFLALPCR